MAIIVRIHCPVCPTGIIPVATHVEAYTIYQLLGMPVVCDDCRQQGREAKRPELITMHCSFCKEDIPLPEDDKIFSVQQLQARKGCDCCVAELSIRRTGLENGCCRLESLADDLANLIGHLNGGICDEQLLAKAVNYHHPQNVYLAADVLRIAIREWRDSHAPTATPTLL